ncbi:MAG TPA: XrtA system polysaccharide deacetylase [Gemmatimonadales bacterium]|nr:XrtA system polysaccharide deacetylase [Gemmatimonadales bacterium]
MTSPVRHVFSVDVEEYFHALALAEAAPRERWASLPSRVEWSTDAILELLARHGAHGTFFVVGWVAEQYPHLVRRIAEAGHEIASHSHFHEQVFRLSPEAFRADLRRSKAALEQCVGQPVLGYRAPCFSIIPGTEWAFDVLLEEEFAYDSSVFPFKRHEYGYPGAPCRPYSIRRASGTLIELPLTTTTIAGKRLPAAGGAYLRQLPFALVSRAFEEATARGIPGMFYVHPWEVDPDQPRLPVGVVSRLRHYRGLGGMMARMERLLARFSFTSVERAIDLPALRTAA